MSATPGSVPDAPRRSAGRRLRGAYLRAHHARVREASDHPVVHVRRMLAAVVRARGDGGVLCDVGAGFEGSRLGRWSGRRIGIDIAAARGVDVVADGHALPLRDKCADAVVLMEVLEHVPTPLGLLRECARVLQPGGFVCLTAPQYCILHGHPGDYYRYTNQGLDYLCREAGLRIVDVRATGGPALVLFHA
ncbi:MAG TPA: class I SAM-dependent methyltransferase, partial [Candidatus Limnocylindria bacterium]|nr:class I SAM-dependent methyltransferase [Candidatus Limnocylindria bacterium]